MKQPSTLQEHFEAIKNGTGNKDVFLKEAKRLYSGLIPNAATFDQTVKIFKNRGVLNENYIDLKPISGYEEGSSKEPWETAFKSFLKEQEESVKAETTKASKYEEDAKKQGYDNSDVKNLDNQVGQEVLNGIAFEARENPDKTLDEIRSIVSKNLAKDPLHYVKNAMFGIKGVGVSDEIPGLKVSKTDQMTPVKMKSLNESKKQIIKEYGEDSGGQDMTWNRYSDKSSNKDNGNKDFIDKGKEDYYDGIPLDKSPYESGHNPFYKTDISKLWKSGWKQAHTEDTGKEYPEDEEIDKNYDDSHLSDYDEANLNESKASKLDQRLKDIHKAGDIVTLEAKMEAIDEEINAKNERIDMIGENEDLAELVNPIKLREMKKEIKNLEREKTKLQKVYEKMTGQKKAEVIDEPQEVESEETGEMAEMYNDREKINESAEEDYINDEFSKGDRVRFSGGSNYQGEEVIWGIIVKVDGPYLTIKGEDGKEYHENANDVEAYDWDIDSEEITESEEAINENIESDPKIDSKLAKFDDMSDEELIKWAEDDDCKDMIEYNEEGKISNKRDILIHILDLYDYPKEDEDDSITYNTTGI